MPSGDPQPGEVWAGMGLVVEVVRRDALGAVIYVPIDGGSVTGNGLGLFLDRFKRVVAMAMADDNPFDDLAQLDELAARLDWSALVGELWLDGGGRPGRVVGVKGAAARVEVHWGQTLQVLTIDKRVFVACWTPLLQPLIICTTGGL